MKIIDHLMNNPPQMPERYLTYWPDFLLYSEQGLTIQDAAGDIPAPIFAFLSSVRKRIGK